MSVYFLSYDRTTWHEGSQFPDQGWAPCPRMGSAVLTTRPLGKSREINFNNIYHPVSRVLFQPAINVKLTGALRISHIGLGKLVCVLWPSAALAVDEPHEPAPQTLQAHAVSVWPSSLLSQRPGSSVGGRRQASVVKRTPFLTRVLCSDTLLLSGLCAGVRTGMAVVLKQFAAAQFLSDWLRLESESCS